MKADRGLPRLRALFGHWMARTAIEIDQGCIYISGAIEFEDRDGPVRDALVTSMTLWLNALKRAVTQAKATGELTPDTDEAQVTFEIHGLILTLHYQARFMRSADALARAQTSFEHILARYLFSGHTN